jgi:hypothetical protein
MVGASAAEILAVWERGAEQSWSARGLTLLAQWPPPEQPDNVAMLSIGARDAWLWQVRARLFGPRVACCMECPACASPLQFELDARQAARRRAGSGFASDEIDSAGFHVRFRALTSGDLLDTEGLSDVAAIRGGLVERAILNSRRGNESIAISDLPTEVIEAVGRRLTEADGAELLLDLKCAVCGHAWQEPFDILSFFWSEVSRSAKRLLHEVHVLAWAYGWSEADILSMSPARRRLYLEWVT